MAKAIRHPKRSSSLPSYERLARLNAALLVALESIPAVEMLRHGDDLQRLYAASVAVQAELSEFTEAYKGACSKLAFPSAVRAKSALSPVPVSKHNYA